MLQDRQDEERAGDSRRTQMAMLIAPAELWQDFIINRGEKVDQRGYRLTIELGRTSIVPRPAEACGNYFANCNTRGLVNHSSLRAESRRQTESPAEHADASEADFNLILFIQLLNKFTNSSFSIS